MNKCWLFHSWNKWEKVRNYSPCRQISKSYMLLGGNEVYQQRVCKDCGRVQQKYIGFEAERPEQ
jgi:hypothetical protein